MVLFVLAYLGGLLTIVSPCILPVLPFVFARADRPFVRSGLPMLVGMALTFAVVATLAAVAGGWAVQANEYGRGAAIVLLALFGLALLFPVLPDRCRPPRGERRDLAAVAHLRGGRRDIAGAGAPCRRASVCRHETFAWGRRMDSPWPGRCGA